MTDHQNWCDNYGLGDGDSVCSCNRPDPTPVTTARADWRECLGCNTQFSRLDTPDHPDYRACASCGDHVRDDWAKRLLSLPVLETR